MSDANSNNATPEEKRKYGPLRAFSTVLSAFFGVQSSANKARDDKYGNMVLFFTCGLVALALLIGAIWLLVWVVMLQAG